jgi:hypothetical protein
MRSAHPYLGLNFGPSRQQKLAPLLPGSLAKPLKPFVERRVLGQRRTSDRGMTSYSPPFPCCNAKSNTQTPNVGYLYSDLTMILPTKFDLFATVIGCTCVHPCPMLGPPPAGDNASSFSLSKYENTVCKLTCTLDFLIL